MKIKLIGMAVVATAAVSLMGCANSATPTASTRPYYDTEKKVYSKEELDKRGRQTPGEALAAQDASITYSGRH